MGDSVARLPAVKYIANYHKHVQQHLWVHSYFKEFAKNSLRDTNIIVRSWEEKNKFKERLTRCFTAHRYNNMASPMTDHAFHILVNRDVEDEHKNYLKPNLEKVDLIKFNLPKNYVVICPYFTAPAREFTGETVNAIAIYIKNKGYDVVFLGKTETVTGTQHIIKGNLNTEVDFSLGLDLSNKTSLLETTKILGEAKAVIGLDSGLLHLAACTDVAIVGGFTTVEPRMRLPFRNNVRGWNYYPVVPPKSLACRFCQSNQTFTYNHDFKLCFYKDYACVKQLTSELYIEQLERIL